jgi:hypothetical protein
MSRLGRTRLLLCSNHSSVACDRMSYCRLGAPGYSALADQMGREALGKRRLRRRLGAECCGPRCRSPRNSLMEFPRCPLDTALKGKFPHSVVSRAIVFLILETSAAHFEAGICDMFRAIRTDKRVRDLSKFRLEHHPPSLGPSRLNVPNLTIADHVNYGVHSGRDGVPIRAILVPSGSRNSARYRCSRDYGIHAPVATGHPT